MRLREPISSSEGLNIGPRINDRFDGDDSLSRNENPSPNNQGEAAHYESIHIARTHLVTHISAARYAVCQDPQITEFGTAEHFLNVWGAQNSEPLLVTEIETDSLSLATSRLQHYLDRLSTRIIDRTEVLLPAPVTQSNLRTTSVQPIRVNGHDLAVEWTRLSPRSKGAT